MESAGARAQPRGYRKSFYHEVFVALAAIRDGLCRPHRGPLSLPSSMHGHTPGRRMLPGPRLQAWHLHTRMDEMP
ncbi:unnamed protein product, partial [Mesorhabditis spiculigera]